MLLPVSPGLAEVNRYDTPAVVVGQTLLIIWAGITGKVNPKSGREIVAGKDESLLFPTELGGAELKARFRGLK